MKTIQIDDDVYEHLLKNTSYIGEEASSILKRLLKLGQPAGPVTAKEQRSTPLITTVTSAASAASSPIDECLASSRVLAEREAVGRFLAILSWLYQKHRDDFDRVLLIEGRIRKYFARTAEELADSGSSVNPQKIPSSPFWVVTNNDTPKKARMLGAVLQVLGYGQADISKIERSLN